MRVDEHREHAERAIVFDEAHPAHVRGEIIDLCGIAQRGLASFSLLKIQLQILDLGKDLVPVIKRLLINGANVPMALAKQVTHQMTADEPTGAADDNFI